MRKAFTLIELLVVIAIIAILAAILFPVFAQAKAAAKKTQALSNVKELATSYLLYLGDTDDTFMEACQGQSAGLQAIPSPKQMTWNGYLEPYKKSIALALDPAAGSVSQSYNGTTYTGLYYQDVDRKQLSLGYNGMFTAQNGYACSQDFSSGTPTCFTFYNANSFAYSSQQLLFVNSAQRQPSQTGAGYIALPNYAINADYGISDRHNQTSTVSFADSHAKSFKSASLLVADQLVGGTNTNPSGMCVNYDGAKVIWDPSAPNANDTPTCEGKGIR